MPTPACQPLVPMTLLAARWGILLLAMMTLALQARGQEPPRRNPFGDLTEGLDEMLEDSNPQDETAPGNPDPATGDQAETENPIQNVLQWMREAADALAAGDAGSQTQQAQRSVVAQLDELLNSGQDRRPQQNSSQQTESQQEESQRSQSAASDQSENEGGENEQSSSEGAGEPAGEERGAADQSAQSEAEAESRSSAPQGSQTGENGAGGNQQGQGDQQGQSGGEGSDGEGNAGRPIGSDGRIGEAGEVTANASGETAKAGDVWGHLPPRVRESLRAVGPKNYLPEYREAIEAYFKSLAESRR